MTGIFKQNKMEQKYEHAKQQNKNYYVIKFSVCSFVCEYTGF